jgi:hypothetical protein
MTVMIAGRSAFSGAALACLLGMALLTGCSGGGATSKQTPSLAGTGTSGTLVPVAITFTIPSSTTSSSKTRRPQFISSGINSAVASALQLQSGTWTPVAAQVYNLAPGSPNCTGSNPRVCTIYLPAAVGNDQFELDTYNGIVGAGSNCTTSATIGTTCSLGSELSSGMDLGPGGNGYAVSLGSSTSVTISLQAIVASIVPGGLYTASISTATGASASGPSFGNPAFVVGAQTNNSTQEVNVCWSDNNGVAFPSESCTGAQNEDASGVTIQQSTSTCSNLQNDFVTAFQLAPATVGGNVNDLTMGAATIQFESCANASAGNNVFVNVALGAGAPQSNPNYEVVDKPAADIFWNYTGGGGGGDESTTAPFWAAATSTTTGFPSGATVPVGITSPAQAATNPQPLTGATSAAKAVTYILAPLYAVVQDAASLGGTQRESAGTNNVTLNLAGPDGYTAKLYAAQAAVPSNQSATGYQVIQPGSCAGVFTLGTKTAGKWGAVWPINGGGTAASGTTCQVLVYDNDQPTNHYAVVTITNTVAGGPLSFASTRYIYVSGDGAANRVFQYNVPVSSGSTPSATISTGLRGPDFLALDSVGRLYVANTTSGTVTIYAQPISNASAPVATISNGLSRGDDYGVALDSAGNLYVENLFSASVVIYPAPLSNASTPSATITGGLSSAFDAVFDAAGNLYVTDFFGGDVAIFTPPFSNASTPAATITNGLLSPIGVALDSSGNLYVADENAGLIIYAPPFGNASAPVATIPDSGATGVAVDTFGVLYVTHAAAMSSTVNVYRPPFTNSSTPSTTFTSLGAWGIVTY